VYPLKAMQGPWSAGWARISVGLPQKASGQEPKGIEAQSTMKWMKQSLLGWGQGWGLQGPTKEGLMINIEINSKPKNQILQTNNHNLQRFMPQNEERPLSNLCKTPHFVMTCFTKWFSDLGFLAWIACSCW
jgi:hypothetical protein